MYRKSTELPNRTQEQLNLPNVVRVKPTMSDISGTCDRPLSWLKGGIHYVKPQSNRKCNQQHIPRVLHILTGEYYQSQQANLPTRHLCFGAIPMVTFGAVQSTVQAPPTGQPCITMLSNRYASIPCQASLRPAIYGPIFGRQFMGQFKAGKIMGQILWPAIIEADPFGIYRFRVITFVFTTEVEPSHDDDRQLLN